MAQPTPDTQTELERREAALAAREAELARQQAELQAQKADFEQGKKRLLDNGRKDFVIPVIPSCAPRTAPSSTVL